MERRHSIPRARGRGGEVREWGEKKGHQPDMDPTSLGIEPGSLVVEPGLLYVYFSPLYMELGLLGMT